MAVPLCQISGTLNDPAGNALANATVTFNTYRVQIVNAEVVAPVVISTTTDDQGNLSPIAIAQGVTVQITINNFAPVNAIVPFVGQTTISTLLAGAVGSQNLSGAFSILTFTGSATPAPSSSGTAILLYSVNTNSVLLSANGGAYFRVLTEDDFPITVPQGGTGVVNIPANSIVMGNGVGSVLNIAPGGVGTVLIGTGTGTPPVFSANAELSVLVITGQISTPLIEADVVNADDINVTGTVTADALVANTLTLATAPTITTGPIREVPFSLADAVDSGAAVRSGSIWTFPDGVGDTAIGAFSIPWPVDYQANGVWQIIFYFSAATAVTGDFALFLSSITLYRYDAVPTVIGAQTVAAPVAGTAGIAGLGVVYGDGVGFPLSTIAAIAVAPGRASSNPSDTATGVMNLLGVGLRYRARN